MNLKSLITGMNSSIYASAKQAVSLLEGSNKLHVQS